MQLKTNLNLMLSKVFNTLRFHGINPNSRILCAISGGIDSVVMLHCLYEYGSDCVVAHCNFQLRSEESNKDEEFVKNLAWKLEYKFISEKFNTKEYATKAGISIQMAARDLRFEWFYQMSEKYKCDYIALAHNSDDQVETMIFNLIRGTGIRGLTGMKTLNEKLLRPLLNVSRKEIEKYATEDYIKYREDKTNAKTEYSRNKIRHLIFPLMEEINPNFRNNAFNSSVYLTDTCKVYEDYIYKIKQKCVKYAEDKVFINLNILKKTPAQRTLLFEILSLESLPNAFASEVLDLIDSQPGKVSNYRNIEVLKDRDYIIIRTAKSVNDESEYLINDIDDIITKPIKIKLIKTSKDDGFSIIKDSDIAMLDYDKLKFPLKIRKWKDGDRFKPLGMKNFKKLSDFFTDIKLNLFDKSEIRVIVSGNEIVWIIGHRIDDRFKITDKTKKIYVCSIIT